MSNNLHTMLNSKIESALEGRNVAIQLTEQYGLGRDDLWLIMPTNDSKLNNTALQILPEYMVKMYLQRVLILTENSDMLKFAKGFLEMHSVIIPDIQYAEIEAIIDYYRLVQFTSDILIVSLDEPYAFSAWIGQYGVTFDSFLHDAIFLEKELDGLGGMIKAA